ncbi:MAG: hypothetical protein U0183_07845 [Polyangiaceae bacterium]
MSSLSLPLAAAFSLGAFATLSFYDGVVVHLVRERLPLREAAFVEHRLHTARAVLFPLLLWSVFGWHGPRSVALALVVADQAFEVWDMAVERRSRAHTGGLPSSEYLVHGWLVGLRSAALAFTFAIDRAHDDTAPLDALAGLLAPGAVAIAAVHVALALPFGRALFGRLRGLHAG